MGRRPDGLRCQRVFRRRPSRARSPPSRATQARRSFPVLPANPISGYNSRGRQPCPMTTLSTGPPRWGPVSARASSRRSGRRAGHVGRGAGPAGAGRRACGTGGRRWSAPHAARIQWGREAGTPEAPRLHSRRSGAAALATGHRTRPRRAPARPPAPQAVLPTTRQRSHTTANPSIHGHIPAPIAASDHPSPPQPPPARLTRRLMAL